MTRCQYCRAECSELATHYLTCPDVVAAFGVVVKPKAAAWSCEKCGRGNNRSKARTKLCTGCYTAEICEERNNRRITKKWCK